MGLRQRVHGEAAVPQSDGVSDGVRVGRRQTSSRDSHGSLCRDRRVVKTKQRVQVLLFDEPLSNLDATLRVKMRVELKKLHDRLGTTGICVTHDQVEAMTLGDRVVVMKDGWVQQVGEPLELYNKPAQVRRRLPRLASDELRDGDDGRGRRRPLGRNRGAAHQDPGRGSRPAAPICSGETIMLGIRPEDLRVATDGDPEELTFEALVEVVEKLG
jgi:multiple sugar transport system ATP-binding protein